MLAPSPGRAGAVVFVAFKVAGAAYLAFLGCRTLVAAARHPLRQGLMTELNPKIALLYATLLPQFISPGDPALLMSLAMATIHGVLGLVWLSAYARLIVTAAGCFVAHVRAALDALAGTVLVGLGIRLASEERP